MIIGTKPNGELLSALNKSWGIYAVIGCSGAGKTLLVKNIYCQDHKPFIIFDFSGEHSFPSKSPNIFSRDKNWANFVPDLEVVNNLEMPIWKFGSVKDWMSLNITEKGAEILSRYAKHTWRNFKEFKKVIKDLPITRKEVEEFQFKYGIEQPKIHTLVYDAILNSLIYLEKIFQVRNSRRIDNFYQFFREHQKISVNLELGSGQVDSEAQKIRARLFVGKILEELSRYDYGNYDIFVEEADLLVPYLESGTRCSSAEWICHYAHKLCRRKNIRLFIITQYMNTLDIKLQEKFSKVIQYLHKYEDRSLFRIADTDAINSNFKYGRWNLFKPMDVSCQYEAWPEIYPPRNRKLHFP